MQFENTLVNLELSDIAYVYMQTELLMLERFLDVIVNANFLLRIYYVYDFDFCWYWF